MTDETDRRLSEVITAMRDAGHPKSDVQRDFASTRAYQIGFAHGVEAALEVFAYAGLITDPTYLLYETEIHDDDLLAKVLVASWENVTAEVSPT
jgi:hypothetical protein